MPNKPAKAGDPYKGVKTGGWSKYGGARQSLVRAKQDIWNCQCCGEDQPKDFPGFFITHELSGELVKICAKCYLKARSKHFSYQSVRIEITNQYRY